MEAIVHDEIDANPNRLDEETLFREGIRLQQTPAKRSNRLVIFGVFSVQRREIEIENVSEMFLSPTFVRKMSARELDPLYTAETDS